LQDIRGRWEEQLAGLTGVEAEEARKRCEAELSCCRRKHRLDKMDSGLASLMSLLVDRRKL
jgi:hypothetical protein